jgi:hypothetical protein
MVNDCYNAKYLSPASKSLGVGQRQLQAEDPLNISTTECSVAS